MKEGSANHNGRFKHWLALCCLTLCHVELLVAKSFPSNLQNFTRIASYNGPLQPDSCTGGNAHAFCGTTRSQVVAAPAAELTPGSL